ncbi:MAG: DUF3426 domain-containing protein [Gammaproteobacteria bacterium]|nr:MAG: DUF3426 domain-containing protein [Gammaproteobacteria bacterium]
MKEVKYHYARCIHCNTVFKVNAEQLEVADGFVRCGMCHQPFNAAENLQDSPVDSRDQVSSVSDGNEGYSSDLIEKTIKKSWFSGKLKSSVSIGSEKVEPTIEEFNEEPEEIKSHVFTVVGGIDHIWDDSPEHCGPVVESGSNDEDEETELEEKIEDAGIQQEKKRVSKSMLAKQLESDLDDPLPEVIEVEVLPVNSDVLSHSDIDIRNEIEKIEQKIEVKKHIKHVALWSSVIVILLVMLLLQTIYFFRMDLVKYGEVRPVLEAMCNITGCRLPFRSEPEHIKISSYSQRQHEQHPGVIIYEAVIYNEADYPLLLPVLEIRFSDNDGQDIGKRQFLPKEYLDKSQRAVTDTIKKRGMADVYLEIVSPGNGVDSVQADFF